MHFFHIQSQLSWSFIKYPVFNPLAFDSIPDIDDLSVWNYHVSVGLFPILSLYSFGLCLLSSLCSTNLITAASYECFIIKKVLLIIFLSTTLIHPECLCIHMYFRVCRHIWWKKTLLRLWFEFYLSNSLIWQALTPLN